MKRVVKVKCEHGEAVVNLKSGKKVPYKTRTTYTYYNDGSNDCNVEMLQPLNIFSEQKEIS